MSFSKSREKKTWANANYTASLKINPNQKDVDAATKRVFRIGTTEQLTLRRAESHALPPCILTRRDRVTFAGRRSSVDVDVDVDVDVESGIALALGNGSWITVRCDQVPMAMTISHSKILHLESDERSRQLVHSGDL